MDYSIGQKAEISKPLLRALQGDRRAQFVDRLGWDLFVSPEGLETDEYDGEGTTFLVVHEGDQHVGSCRVRPVGAGTMLIDHFSDAFPEAAAFLASQTGRIWELTRFCRSPNTGTQEAKEMLRVLADVLDTFRDDNGITGYVAVVYPEVGRFLRRIGVRYIQLSAAKIGGRDAHLICITHCVAAEKLSADRKRGAEFLRRVRHEDSGRVAQVA